MYLFKNHHSLVITQKLLTFHLAYKLTHRVHIHLIQTNIHTHSSEFTIKIMFNKCTFLPNPH